MGSKQGVLSLTTGLTLIATLGGLLFGYDTAVISGAMASIDINFIKPLNLTETAHDSLKGLTISSALAGCVVGGLVAGKMADRFGRKPTLIFAALMFLICSLGSAWPEFGLGTIGQMGPDALTPFNIYRIIGGVGVGIASLVSPLYIAEIAPAESRGRLISFNQIAIVGGMVGVYFVNWAIAGLGDETWLHSTGWRYMFASEGIPSLLFALLLLLAPDTPRYLVMQRRDNEALAVLKRLGGATDPKVTLVEIEESLVVTNERLFAFGGLVVFVGILLSVFQQFVGINAVLYYAPQMFQNMGMDTNASLWQTVIVGIANVAFTLVATVSVDRLGRKPLLIAGGLVMTVSMLALGTIFATGQAGLAALAAMLVYIAGFAFSWGPVVWILLAEMFPNAIKGKALGIAVAAQWIANLVVTWSFNVMDGNSVLNAHFHHGFAYWIYGVFSLLSALFVWRFVPETKGRSLEAIQELWTHKPLHAAVQQVKAARS
ncbi:D-xylose transporter XylE [Nitrospirillum sp. BR 11164]|uniref:D-xylose transporter XylE n=1 Tax=Nitrospirillum sp. BR 11164 TaxID=3104324 RepID=UPI002B0022CD|nr:D-xylose transporter XylE [Nitrospirillum sp. BR 11164]MEA1652461.1 D-xylose transporter XylE [Nitrospirillum sp. BR 11164]